MKLFNSITKNIGANGNVVVKHVVGSNGNIKTTLSITVESSDPEVNNNIIEDALSLSITGPALETTEPETKEPKQKKAADFDIKERLAKYEAEGDAKFQEKQYESAINYYAACLELKESKKVRAKYDTAVKWDKATSAMAETVPQPKEQVVDENIFVTLTSEQEDSYRSWARQNYKTGYPISPVWHPVVQDECAIMLMEIESRGGSVGLPSEKLLSDVGYEEYASVMGTVMIEEGFTNPIINEIYTEGIKDLDNNGSSDFLPEPFSI